MGIKISELTQGVANPDSVVPATNSEGTSTEKVKLGDIAKLGVMNAGTGVGSIVGLGSNNSASGPHSSALAGQGNSAGNSNSHVIGSNITTDADNTTFVNNLKIVGVGGSGGITFPDGTTQNTSGISEAPSDGNLYGRENGAWTNVAQASNLQLRRGTEAERVQITPLEGEPIYTTDSKKLYVGDGQTVGGNEIISADTPQLNPRGMARFVSITDAQTIWFNSVRSTTGYVGVLWWDGSVQVYGSGNPNSDISIQKSAPISGNWSGAAPKEFFFWSSGSTGFKSGDLTMIKSSYLTGLTSLDVRGLSALTALATGGGELTSLDLTGLTSLTELRCSNNKLTNLDVSGLTGLTILYCNNNLISSLNLGNLPVLQYLFCQQNHIVSLNLSGLPSLLQFDCSTNLLGSLDVSNNSELTIFYCYSNSISSLNIFSNTKLKTLWCFDNSISSLNTSNNTSLLFLSCTDNNISSLNLSNNFNITTLLCKSNSLTSLDISGLTSLSRIDCSNNQLTSVRAQSVALAGSVHPFFGTVTLGGDLRNNSLSAAAIDQFYTDLSPRAGYIDVSGNPGAATDDPTIATAKGYTVFST